MNALLIKKILLKESNKKNKSSHIQAHYVWGKYKSLDSVVKELKMLLFPLVHVPIPLTVSISVAILLFHTKHFLSSQIEVLVMKLLIFSGRFLSHVLLAKFSFVFRNTNTFYFFAIFKYLIYYYDNKELLLWFIL